MAKRVAKRASLEEMLRNVALWLVLACAFGPAIGPRRVSPPREIHFLPALLQNWLASPRPCHYSAVLHSASILSYNRSSFSSSSHVTCYAFCYAILTPWVAHVRFIWFSCKSVPLRDTSVVVSSPPHANSPHFFLFCLRIKIRLELTWSGQELLFKQCFVIQSSEINCAFLEKQMGNMRKIRLWVYFQFFFKR